MEEARRLARENAKDIIACGFDARRTFIFSDFEYVGGTFYRNIARIQRCAMWAANWLCQLWHCGHPEVQCPASGPPQKHWMGGI